MGTQTQNQEYTRPQAGMIKYLGSKRLLVLWILGVAEQLAEAGPLQSVVDLFSGSTRVAKAFKKAGYSVTANDQNTYAYILAKAHIESDRTTYPPSLVNPILKRLMTLPATRGFITRAYCEQARFFQPKNGMRIDAIRAGIEEEAGNDELLRAILLTSLLAAADKVDSTTGMHMAYLKSWAPRSFNDLKLVYPELLPGSGSAYRLDALELAKSLEADLFYLDPPYNQHAYLANYHIWETLVLDDRPLTYGRANKRLDCRVRKSPFNSKRLAYNAMEKLLVAIGRHKHVILSFNDEGFLDSQQIEELLSHLGYVVRFTREHRRYVGARIGIYNPGGERVGQVSHTTNHEYLYVATQSKRAAELLGYHQGR